LILMKMSNNRIGVTNKVQGALFVFI